MNKRKSLLITAVVAVFIVLDIVGGRTYNIMDFESMLYLGFFMLVIAAIIFGDRNDIKKSSKPFIIFASVIVLVFLVGSIFSSRLLNAQRYANVIGEIQPIEFKDLYGKDHEIEPSFVDKDSALLAADKKMGELSDVSALFDMNRNEFAQINYKGNMVRVSPFEYTDTLKKYLNMSSGIPYYMLVTTGDGAMNAKAEIVTLDNPIRYYPGAPFMYDLKRHVAMNHKFSYLGGWTFEIDESGHPYWVVQAITRRVGIWGAKDMDGIITVDAVTGDTNRYDLERVPEWVDSVYPTDMLLSHAKDHFTLSGGYFNSFMQQKGVMQVDQAEGSYNYISIDGDIYVFSGIRPIKVDSSSTTGLLFMNRSTGETLRMDVPGVSITAAEMTSVGSIQEKNYIPTTPTLENVGGYPTYTMALKDTSGVVRGFSMVNYQDYTKSAVGDTYTIAQKNYLNIMGNQAGIIPEDFELIEGIVEEVVHVTIEGNTVVMVRLQNSDKIYQASIVVDDRIVFLKPGMPVKLKVNGLKVMEYEQN